MKKKRPFHRAEARATARTRSSTLENHPADLTIQFPPEGELRVRRIISRAAPRPTTKFFALRLERYVHCESLLEVEVAELLDACPAATSFAEQAMLLTYTMSGEVREHIPDLVVRTATRRLVLEAKFLQTQKEEDLQRAEYLRPLLAAQGYEYFLVDETHTRHHCYLQNARFLLRRARMEPSEETKLLILHHVSTNGMTLGEAIDSPQMTDIMWMIWAGLLTIPMRDAFAPATCITLPAEQGGAPWVLELFK